MRRIALGACLLGLSVAVMVWLRRPSDTDAPLPDHFLRTHYKRCILRTHIKDNYSLLGHLLVVNTEIIKCHRRYLNTGDLDVPAREMVHHCIYQFVLYRE